MTESSQTPTEAPDRRAADLRRALEQKTALLHEVDHRVKNNLQLIASLVLLQKRRTPDPAVRDALSAMLERINAIATVHRRLFQSDDVERFDVAAFAGDLVQDMIGAAGRDNLQVVLRLERVDIDAAHAAPLALLFSELLGNAIRHAFPDGRAGTITVSVRRESPYLLIEIVDDGVGMGTESPPPGFGTTIVKLLCDQLHAEFETTDADPGVRSLIRLPLDRVH
jgi:two-component sensor histidine kinase